MLKSSGILCCLYFQLCFIMECYQLCMSSQYNVMTFTCMDTQHILSGHIISRQVSQVLTSHIRVFATKLGRLFSSVEDNNSIDLLDKVLKTRSVTFFHGNCSCKICNQIWQPYKFLLPSSWLLGAHVSIHYRYRCYTRLSVGY